MFLHLQQSRIWLAESIFQLCDISPVSAPERYTLHLYHSTYSDCHDGQANPPIFFLFCFLFFFYKY